MASNACSLGRLATTFPVSSVIVTGSWGQEDRSGNEVTHPEQEHHKHVAREAKPNNRRATRKPYTSVRMSLMM